MLSRERMVAQGNWLFRWRSYLPLVLLFGIVPRLSYFCYLGDSHFADLCWEAFCLCVSSFGLGVRCYTLGRVPRGTSGRNAKRQIAETLNTTGLYSLTRNPLYLGNFFMMLGVVLFLRDVVLTSAFIALFGVYYERIIFAEEEFLLEKFGKEYVEYAERTPAFFPSRFGWRPPELPFSWKTVLKKEYCGLLGMTASFFALETATDATIYRRFVVDPFWAALLIASVVAFVVLRSLKKYTSVLDVDGR